jgi:hypothetical protein
MTEPISNDTAIIAGAEESNSTGEQVESSQAQQPTGSAGVGAGSSNSSEQADRKLQATWQEGMEDDVQFVQEGPAGNLQLVLSVEGQSPQSGSGEFLCTWVPGQLLQFSHHWLGCCLNTRQESHARICVVSPV